jgi:hypothetical protein
MFNPPMNMSPLPLRDLLCKFSRSELRVEQAGT